MMDSMDRWDYLEKCTCNLLHHPILWESLMTHEIETIYYVSRRIVEIEDKELKLDPQLVTKDNLIYQNDHDELMYFWDRFNSLLIKTEPRDEAGSQLVKAFTKIYSDNYYKPEEYKITFKGEKETMNFKRELSVSCKQLYDNFVPFVFYLNNLKLLSKNPRFAYRMVAYDENLYKLMVSLRMCKFLNLAGVLVEAL